MNSHQSFAQPKGKFRLLPLQEERLERKLALAFGFMSFIPILLIVWSMATKVELGFALFPIVGSAFVGYFIVRHMIRSVLTVAEKARALATGQLTKEIEVTEHNEIGELARSFNRITHELEHKIEELESSRQLVKRLLSRIGTAMNSYEGIDNLMSLILENSTAAMEAQVGTLMLVDGERQELTVKTTWSTNGQTADPGFRLKLGDGVPGWVAREGRPMRGRALASALGFSNTETGDHAVLSVPLKLRDKPIGVLSVLRSDLSKPFADDDEMLLSSISSQVAVAIENYRLNMDVERTYLETIMALALAVEAKDPYSAGHSKRVGFYASQIGEEMGLDAETLRMLNDGGVLHDIGKIGIKDEILLKQAALTLDEQHIMQQHSVIGEAIVKPVRSLQRVVSLVRHHHERVDGAGYPDQLAGEAIPLGARILTVADSYDSMVTDRPYRKRLPVDTAKAELQQLSGQQFDAQVVQAFLRVLARKEQRQDAAAPSK